MPPNGSSSRRVDGFLKRKQQLFARELEVKNLFSELLSKGVIDDSDYEQLIARRRAGASSRELTEDLCCGILRTKSERQKLDFLQVVRQKQPHLVLDSDMAALVEDDVFGLSHQAVHGPLPGACVAAGRSTLNTGALVSVRCVEEMADGDLPPVQRDRPVTRRQVLQLSQNVGSKWKKVARHLPLAGDRDKMAFTEEQITAIEREEDDDEGHCAVALDDWRQLSKRHNWGLLWTAFRDAGLCARAQGVLKAS